MDPDDMYMNEYFLQQLYNSNLKKNFDIIEFSVFNKMKIQIKCVFRTMILKIITKNFQKILFINQNYLKYYFIYLIQILSVKLSAEMFGINYEKRKINKNIQLYRQIIL